VEVAVESEMIRNEWLARLLSRKCRLNEAVLHDFVSSSNGLDDGLDFDKDWQMRYILD
jgi:hypothetical protein